MMKMNGFVDDVNKVMTIMTVVSSILLKHCVSWVLKMWNVELQPEIRVFH